jgi:hypothetical protein
MSPKFTVIAMITKHYKVRKNFSPAVANFEKFFWGGTPPIVAPPEVADHPVQIPWQSLTGKACGPFKIPGKQAKFAEMQLTRRAVL